MSTANEPSFGWTPQPRPGWVDRMNAVGESAGGARLAVPLQADELLATASASTGLDDFGPDTWRQHFNVLIPELDASALHTVGRLVTRSEVLQALRNRLLLADLWKRRPELTHQSIEAPIFVVGTARSGTSITHELLGCDPENLMPTTWKIHHPVEAATGTAAERQHLRSATDGEVTAWHDLAPEYEGMHHNGGDLPTECIFVTTMEFLSDQWSGCFDVPGYAQHLIGADHTDAYRLHKRVLQTLQSADDMTGHRWALKAPSHLPNLDALFAVYPDARIVLLHRNPLETMPSTLSLIGTLKHMRGESGDMSANAPLLAMGYDYMLRSVLDRRASGELPDAQFVDVPYPRLMADPAAAIGDAYERFAIDFSPDLRQSMTDYIAAKPKGKRGGHRYALEHFGLDAGVEAERFAWYCDRFDL